MQSLVGDQLARVALSVLVFTQTGSGLLTAGVYALTYLPSLLGSILLGSLADRMPRRALLVTGDLVRAVLLAVMALPGVPLGVVHLEGERSDADRDVLGDDPAPGGEHGDVLFQNST